LAAQARVAVRLSENLANPGTETPGFFHAKYFVETIAFSIDEFIHLTQRL